MSRPKVIYYAHHLAKYDTLEELKELDLIESNFDNSVIINPNGWINQDADEKTIMEQCFKLVYKSDILVFSSIEDGIIGQGIYGELLKAFTHGVEVYYLNDNKIEPFTDRHFDNISIIVQETKSRRHYAKIVLEGDELWS